MQEAVGSTIEESNNNPPWETLIENVLNKWTPESHSILFDYYLFDCYGDLFDSIQQPSYE